MSAGRLDARESRTINNVIERRSKPRIECAFPAIVRGRESNGKKFESSAVLQNLSASGLYLRLNQRVETGRELFVLVRFSNSAQDNETAHSIATHALILRSELQSDGKSDVAVRFLRYRFL